ncbi:hypothetical protein [Methylobacterium radiotolerans]|uniref:hypothetical protein n=1 Tax=Methylobacterium radiotolerans TaxID=31998 RepID=UPI000D5CDEFD|nr:MULTISPECIES: hypothetical protein [Methylobacterium]MDE3748526.1 hypothetical protein [Methylobacterium radiotolerans]PVY88960.1 hypothetical protein C7388_13639 [Methylobacterium organophilum]
MSRVRGLATALLGLAAGCAQAQAVNPTPGTEAAQSNGLLGMPALLLISIIIAFAVLYALRARRR